MPLPPDIYYMRRALRLARRGRGLVSPNPRVGAVLVDESGSILGEGWHTRWGCAHAEVEALSAAAGRDLRGATMYVTLEPCCHQGKTPACTTALADAGIKRVVAATIDPNPMVNSQGVSCLEKAGIKVDVGLLGAEARYENRGYFTWRLRGRAWCAAKIALSLDGKMANPAGVSKWITCGKARRLAHALRADHDGIIVGGGTVAKDDPELTVRLVKGPNPVRIVLSPRRGLPTESLLARTAGKVSTVLVVGEDGYPPGGNLDGIKVLRLPLGEGGFIDPLQLLRELPRQGVLSVLIEGGSQTLSSFQAAGVIDEIYAAYAPSVIGAGISPFEHFLPQSWEHKPRYAVSTVKRLGSDALVKYSREGDPFLPD